VAKLLKGRRESFVFHKRRAQRAKKARRRRQRLRRKEKKPAKDLRRSHPIRKVVSVDSTGTSSQNKTKSYRKWCRTPNSRFLEWKLRLNTRIESRVEERISRRLVDIASYIESLCMLAIQNRYIVSKLKRLCKDIVYTIDVRNFFDSKKNWNPGPSGLPRWLRGRFYRAFGSQRLRETRTAKL